MWALNTDSPPFISHRFDVRRKAIVVDQVSPTCEYVDYRTHYGVVVVVVVVVVVTEIMSVLEVKQPAPSV